MSDDKLSNRKNSKFSRLFESTIFNATNKQLEQLFILNTIKWSNIPDDATKMNGSVLLFLLLDKSINEDIVYSQLIKD